MKKPKPGTSLGSQNPKRISFQSSIFNCLTPTLQYANTPLPNVSRHSQITLTPLSRRGVGPYGPEAEPLGLRTGGSEGGVFQD